MTTIQDQYLDSLRQTQETWAGAFEYLTKDLRWSFDPQWNPFATLDPDKAVDQVFNFWVKTLEVQRDVTKQLLSATISAAEQARQQAETASAAVRAQVDSVGAAVREQADATTSAFLKQAESVNSAVREQAASVAKVTNPETYEDLTKAELQDELAKRDLPKTGNVDDLRERLVADDHS